MKDCNRIRRSCILNEMLAQENGFLSYASHTFEMKKKLVVDILKHIHSLNESDAYSEFKHIFYTYTIVYNVENHLNRIPCHTCTIKLQIKNMHEMHSM